MAVPPVVANATKGNKSVELDSLNFFNPNPVCSPGSANSQPDSVGKRLNGDESEQKEPDSMLERLLPYTLRETPSWLISLTVHVAIILLLALIPLSERIRSSMSVLAGMGELEEMVSFDLSSNASELEAGEAMATLPDIVSTELVVPDFKPSLMQSDLVIPMSLSNGLRGRTGEMKGALLRKFGGTQGTEDAVEAGLKWLDRNQRSDGSWSLTGPYNDGGVTENRSAATAMALLAFMGAGNTHKTGPYKENVRKGIEVIKRLQDKEGFFAAQAVGNQRTYAQAQCTIAICELYGMSGDEELREGAQKAVRYAQKSQNKMGGWRYDPPRDGADTCVTGWYVMALISARMAGLDVDSESLERVHGFLDTVQRLGRTTKPDSQGERYAYQSYNIAIPSMTAEGMLCRLYLGWNTKDPRIESGATFLNSQPMSTDNGRISYYYWYYATTTLHHIGGSHWTQWNEAMKEVLPGLQIPSGKERGSWPPGGDPHEGAGGRLYATCFALYCLESYYRHLPLSDMAPKQ
ncbi:MAG: terpene cyclase/mutase family protein [Planctomycetota bacterium]|nr:terpene cyclase/mutase family protein [Planctomycetota bacterium]